MKKHDCASEEEEEEEEEEEWEEDANANGYEDSHDASKPESRTNSGNDHGIKAVKLRKRLRISSRLTSKGDESLVTPLEGKTDGGGLSEKSKIECYFCSETLSDELIYLEHQKTNLC